MTRKKNVFWGVVLLLLAVLLLAHRLGYLKEIRFWPVLLSIVLVVFFVKGIFRGSFGMILFSMAFFVIVNDELLHLEAITPWPVLGAALLGTMGLRILFPGFVGKRWKKFFFKDGCGGLVSQESRSGRGFAYENVFSSAVKYVSGDVENVNIENVFGSMDVYFVDAHLPEGTIHVNMDLAFGSVTLYVPASWTVNMNMERVFSGVKERGKCIPDERNAMYISGDVVFSGVTIVYV